MCTPVGAKCLVIYSERLGLRGLGDCVDSWYRGGGGSGRFRALRWFYSVDDDERELILCRLPVRRGRIFNL